MTQKQKERIQQELIQVLSNHPVTYADVPEILESLSKELKELSQQQFIRIP
ncbi:hypothetical protein [Bacillus mesophilum]|uniref:hypothetical protein n=1 Tax=Bacillus mesophilum TaxID=1071718 RepID=UPI001375F340|nr:hypothetical protein [Bacillus mesophilum]